MKPKVIVSLTSHDIRLKNETVTRVVFQILKGTFKDLRVCLTLFKEDVKLIPPRLQEFIDLELVELIIADKDLGPHLKYFYAMQKYRDLPIITIDDDIFYPTDMVENLFNAYEKHKCIIGRRCYAITPELDYNLWLKTGCKYSDYPTHNLFATGVGGILYPPDCLRISEKNIPEIMKIRTDDDFYLKALEVRSDVKIVAYYETNMFAQNLNDPCTQSIGRWHENLKNANFGIELFKEEFKKCLE